MLDEVNAQNLSTTIISFIANVDINDEKANELANRLTDSIARKRLKLLELVIALKEHLISEETSERRKALLCLSNVLAELPEDLLLKNEVSVVFSFYLSKFEDAELMKETLFGISSLVKMTYISIINTDTVLNILSDEYKPSSFLAPVRFFAIKIMENMYAKNHKKLTDDESFADRFIKCFLHIVNGEKDPRNLLLSFKLNRQISSDLKSVIKFKEELFDVLFCYFPITFKPPKNDPYKISNSDLKVALRNALSATPEFSEDAFGNLIDKLTASSPSVKNDTLLTLKACIESFGGESAFKHWLPLWNALKFEIMHNNDNGDISLSNSEAEFIDTNNNQAALDVMKSLAYQLLQFEETAFDKFFSHIFEELKPNFAYDKDLKQSCSVLASIGSADITTFNKVIGNTLPLFLESTSEISKLKLVIMNLSFFFDAYIAVFDTSIEGSTDLAAENKLMYFKDEILMILGKALTGTSKIETSIRTLSVIQFTKMVKMRGYLTRDETALIVQYLTETILTDTNKNIYCACLEGLKAIGDIHEDLIHEVSLKKLLELLPSIPTEAIALRDGEPVEKENILRVILDFTNSKHKLIKESVSGLSSKLCLVASQKGSNEYCFLLASSLYTLLSNNIGLIRESDAAFFKKTVEAQLLNIMMHSSDTQIDEHTFSLLSNVLFFINLKTSVSTHQHELDNFVQYFIGEAKILEEPSRCVVPFTKLLSAISKACKLEDDSLMLEKAIYVLKNNNASIPEIARLGYLELLMVLANKWVKEESLQEICGCGDLSSTNLETLVWIGKGLVMKNSPLGVRLQDILIKQLSNKELGAFVARLFEVFVIDVTSMERYKGVTWSNNTKLLYKQKFFCEVFPKLVESYKSTSELSIKSNYLTSLSLILKHIPNRIIEPYMEELLPLLLQALDLPTAEVRISALSTLKDTAEKFHQLITEHVQTLFPTLMKLVTPEKCNNIIVRLLTLELLETLSSVVPLNYALPYKNDIIRALEPVLDDKKRVVRRQCVITRQSFFELGQVPFE